MLPSVGLKCVLFKVSSSVFQMRKAVHRAHLRPRWILYLLQDVKCKDIGFDVPEIYISEEIKLQVVKIGTTCQKSRMLVPEFGLLRY